MMKTIATLSSALVGIAGAQPIVIAHRGASGYLPEHTLEAKAMAHAMGADFIEQDIVLTKDDVPVVMHDIYLDTISDVAQKFPDRHRANGRYYALDFTLAEIKQLNATERFSEKTGKQVYPKRFPKGASSFQIPTLEEELELIEGLNKSTGRAAGIYPEIKQPKWHRSEGHDISAIVLPILKKHGYATKTDACIVQCFEFEEVKRIRTELGWEGRLIYLMGSFKKGEKVTNEKPSLAEIAKVADGIGPAISADIVDVVAQAHAAGLQVHPYTLRIDDLPKWAKSTEELLHLLFDVAKVDGLFSDFPDVAVRHAHGGK
ncbi:MAG: glycerophosphodiester phosphodiesterase [Verrucomicrobiaceae bacterium]|nr:glycerophosphodiester phosphodiesterase [Verrucomicrobiaceae bacterium]